MSIPEHKIQEVLERVDLVTLVGRHVELKKSGRSYKGRCPFHQEKSASFYVTPEMRRFKCFGCSAGGDAISFLQRYLGKTFLDAVRELAREVGVDLEAEQDPSAKERQQVKEATDFAQEHFRALLWSDEGARARAYLADRGVSEDVAKQFGLGWAGASWTGLADKLGKNGMLEWGLKAGLVAPRTKSDGYYDFFRNRVMIPIRSPEGRPIAFGGRLLMPPGEAEQGPKYLNSRESQLYNKSNTLYGLDAAREEIRRRKSAVLVEGYFDAIGLQAAGVKHAVALCSTALTPGHLAALSRLEAKELVLLLDGDAAGLAAVERLAGALLAAGAPTQVALLPQGDDPDTFARREGREGVERLLAAARPLTAHLFGTVLPAGKEASFEEKMKALERLRGVCSLLPVGLVRSAFFGALGSHFGLPAAELEQSLRGKAPPPRPVPRPGDGPAAGARPGAFARPGPSAPGSARPGDGASAPGPMMAARPAPPRPPDPLEATYAALLLRAPALSEKDAWRVGDELSHPGLRAVLAQALGGSVEEALFDAAEPVKQALDLAGRPLPEDVIALEQVFYAVCQRLKIRRIDEQLRHIARVTGQLDGASDLTEEARRLLTQRNELLALKKRVLGEPPTSGPPPAPS